MRILRQSRWFLLFFVVSLSLLMACSDSRATVEVQFVNPDGSESPTVVAELATTDSERRLGLMYRKNLSTEHGMLFLFPSELERSFWMKNTYLELDIVFLDSSFSVVSITKKAVPLSESPRKSEKPAKYVLEVLGGQTDAWGVGVGSTLRVSGELPAAR